MRLLILKHPYPRYLAWYHARRPGEVAKPYAEQMAAFDRDAFWWGDFWVPALAPLGWEVTQVVANAEPLQRAWARERGVETGAVDWMFPVLRDQLDAIRPDVVFLQSPRGLDARMIRELRAGCPSIRAVAAWCGAAPVERDAFAACDLVLSCVPELVEALERAGHRAFHLHHAFDPRVLERIDTTRDRSIEVSFVGDILSQQKAGDRAGLLQRLAAELPLEVYAHVGDGPAARLAKTALGKVAYRVAWALRRLGVRRSALLALPGIGRAADWSESPVYRRIPLGRDTLRDPVYGVAMLQVLRDSKVTLNVHRTFARSASNLRLYEACGVGTCQLTDWKPNLGALFEVDAEIVAWRSEAECVEKARWLLDHPEEREAIAAAGQRRVLRDHTFARRAPELDRLLRAAI